MLTDRHVHQRNAIAMTKIITAVNESPPGGCEIWGDTRSLIITEPRPK